ncbi:MAG: hypothetical protein KA715_10540 [Xanthomonadaceae bacterium]|nr:hypothetical protein [Xanthomonadaceae bacterium]
MRNYTWPLIVLAAYLSTFGMMVSLSASQNDQTNRMPSSAVEAPKIALESQFKLIHMDAREHYRHYNGVNSQTQINSSFRMSAGGIQINIGEIQ